MKLGGTLILAALSLGVALVACGGDDTTSPSATTSGSGSSTGSGSGNACNEDPFACEAGTTCWVSGTQTSPFFECLPAGPGQLGDDCMNYIGSPTCADAMTCFSVSGYPNVCTPYCDPQDSAHACPDGASCLPIQLQGSSAIYFACEPDKGTSSSTTSATGAGGAGGDSGTGGAGGA